MKKALFAISIAVVFMACNNTAENVQEKVDEKVDKVKELIDNTKKEKQAEPEGIKADSLEMKKDTTLTENPDSTGQN